MEKITCPNCSHKFDIEGAIATDVRAQYADEFKRKEQELLDQKNLFEQQKKKENEFFKQRLDKAKLEQEQVLAVKIKEDFTVQLKAQAEELAEKNKKLSDLQEKELENMRLKRKLEDVSKEQEIELQKRLLDEKTQIEEKAEKRVQERWELKSREWAKEKEDQKKLIEEMRRKAQQGSMQLQGEVQELAIEELLRNTFPRDKITAVEKGARGADAIQEVMNEQMISCGKIVYESKRTKAFSAEWINKLKVDQKAHQADIAVLVTATMPKNVTQFERINGVWVCTFQEFKSLVYVLREILLKSSEVKSIQENRGDKMEMLFNFLTSQQFKLQFTGIVDAFTILKEDLDREKKAMQGLWKKREKQLEMVLSNTVDLYGSIKGIAGNSIATVEQLELPDGDELF